VVGIGENISFNESAFFTAMRNRITKGGRGLNLGKVASLACLLVWELGSHCNAAGPDRVDFINNVLPVLQERCFACHGEKKQKGDLRLDSKNSILIGGQSGDPLVDPKFSEIVRRIHLPVNDDDIMPPPGGERAPLSLDERDLIKKWVAQGADFGLWQQGRGVAESPGIPVPAAAVELSSKVPAGTRAYFFASTPETGEEFWTTDGTEAGTRMFSDFYPGPSSANQGAWPTATGVIVKALHEDGEYRILHYKGDDHSIVELRPDGKSLSVGNGVSKGGQVLLDCNLGICQSDGTAGGTEEIGNRDLKKFFGTKDRDQIHHWFEEVSGNAMICAHVRDSRLFQYFGWRPSERRLELLLEMTGQFVPRLFWFSDMGLFYNDPGTVPPEGVRLEGGGLVFQPPGKSMKNLPLGTYDAEFEYGACEVGGKLYFSAAYLQSSQSGETTYKKFGYEPCVSDGTPAGTMMIADILETAGDREGSRPRCFFGFGDKVLFTADDGVHNREPWVFDGKKARLLKDTDTVVVGGYGDCGIQRFVQFNGAVFFAGGGGDQRGLWKTDGTPEGTVLVYPSPVADLVNAGSLMLFTSGYYLWASDGTQAGTKVIKGVTITRSGMPQGALLVNELGLHHRR
jgi:ELWxxDGT repeat protein